MSSLPRLGCLRLLLCKKPRFYLKCSYLLFLFRSSLAILIVEVYISAWSTGPMYNTHESHYSCHFISLQPAVTSLPAGPDVPRLRTLHRKRTRGRSYDTSGIYYADARNINHNAMEFLKKQCGTPIPRS